ncbi:MAG: Acylamidase [Chlamydiae bacterium]|nr:Acylamidase [Chlamydiota bacterium]
MQEEELVYTAGYKIQEMILRNEISCKEVTKVFLKRIEDFNPQLNAYIEILQELALSQAEYIDENLDSLRTEPLVGIPISIKDLLLDIQDVVTTNGSLVCKTMVANNDSLAVERCRNARAVFLGKTNVPEFGSDYITQNRLIDPTVNPWNLSRSPGGSSGGSAASVSAGLASIALANDSAGSIRLPSALCSLFGYMPSFGCVPAISKHEITFKPLHRTGPIARTVKDAAIMLNVLNQPTALDPNSKPPIDFVKLLDKDPRKLTLGWSPDLGFGIRNEETIHIIESRLKELEQLGFKIEEIKMPPDFKNQIEKLSNYIIARFSLLADEIPVLAKPLLGPSITTLINKSLSISHDEFLKASSYREVFRQKMQELMLKYDLLVTPTSVMPSFPIKNFRNEVKKYCEDPFLFFAFLLYPFNVTGQPAASVPCGFTCENLPIGMQIIGPENQDSDIFRFCGYYERAFPWVDRRPHLSRVL